MPDQTIKPPEDLGKVMEKEFLEKVKALSDQYGYDIGAKLQLSEYGIAAIPVIVKLKKDEKK